VPCSPPLKHTTGPTHHSCYCGLLWKQEHLRVAVVVGHLWKQSTVGYLHITMAVGGILKAEQATYTLQQLLLGALLKAEHLHITVAVWGFFQSRVGYLHTLQLLLGALWKLSRPTYLWSASKYGLLYPWIISFSPKLRKMYARNTSREALEKGSPRQVPRSPPLKSTTVHTHSISQCRNSPTPSPPKCLQGHPLMMIYKKMFDIMLYLEAKWPSKQNILIEDTILAESGL